MTTNQSNNTALANLKFANNSKDNWDTFKADFKDLLTHTKGKLDTVAFDNKLHRTVLKKIEAEVRAEQKEAGITSTAAITAAIQDEADEVLEESQSEAFSYLCMCITMGTSMMHRHQKNQIRTANKGTAVFVTCRKKSSAFSIKLAITRADRQ